jgi:formate dehydrogenase major subunit
VRIVSHYGSATLPAQVSPAVREGELFATFHTAKAFLNNVTGDHVDRTAGTPEYKVTAVRLEKV